MAAKLLSSDPNLAFCYESLGEPDDARRVAEEIVKLDRNSNVGLQARALLIELDADDPKRAEKLIRMEGLCRKQGADVTANNIAITRAREAADRPDQVRQILAPVIKSSKANTDYYNKTRAALKLAALSLDSGEKLTESELVYLVGAYHFLFNERMPVLFDQCNDSLWRTFEGSRDTENLLTLFRHSSLYWRLRGEESKEGKYLKNLSKTVGDTITRRRLSSLSREAAYYLVRAGSPQLAEPSPRPALPSGPSA